MTDGLRLDERTFTVHRSTRRLDGAAAADGGADGRLAMRQAVGDDKCRLGYARWPTRSITELTICTRRPGWPGVRAVSTTR